MSTNRTAAATKPRTISYAELPEMVTPEEAGAFLRMSRNAIYDLLKSGAIPSVKYGRLIRIRKAVLIDEGGR